MNNSCDFPRVHCDAKSRCYTCGGPTHTVFFHFHDAKRSMRVRSCHVDVTDMIFCREHDSLVVNILSLILSLEK